ncbi:MAG TPA: tRNA (adenosine(37)-N6)-dimethylallyltransferase MiaA [Candidatus Saccharimonadales bacterium]|nr:tRNA (adenosine(37)-N6)-dimethylallyltransferase MiaA [Candidatus Saccharimonadales bacterium]
MAAGPLIVIVGQTASGKSAMAMDLARKFNGEIICADSRTIYKYMDIGTAKPGKDEQSEVRHYLIDIMDLDKRFNASDFKKLASDSIGSISAKGKVPFLVGGTGLYISSVIYDFRFDDYDDNKLRENTLLIGIKHDPEQLKTRIKHRVDKMIEAGLEAEVRNLADQYGFAAPGMNAICYKEWKDYFAGEQSLEETKQNLYKDNWQYARRQKTWFKRDKNIHWITSVREASVLAQQFLIQ